MVAGVVSFSVQSLLSIFVCSFIVSVWVVMKRAVMIPVFDYIFTIAYIKTGANMAK